MCFAARVSRRARCAVLGIRKDYMVKFRIELGVAEQHCVKGTFMMCRGPRNIHNFYLHLVGNKHV